MGLPPLIYNKMSENEFYNDSASSEASKAALTGSNLHQEIPAMANMLSPESGSVMDGIGFDSNRKILDPSQLKNITDESRQITADNISANTQGESSFNHLGEVSESNDSTSISGTIHEQQKRHSNSDSTTHSKTVNGNDRIRDISLDAKQVGVKEQPLDYVPLPMALHAHHTDGISSSGPNQQNRDRQSHQSSASSLQEKTDLTTNDNISPANSISAFSDEISPQTVTMFPVEIKNGTSASKKGKDSVSRPQHATSFPGGKISHERTTSESIHREETAETQKKNEAESILALSTSVLCPSLQQPTEATSSNFGSLSNSDVEKASRTIPEQPEKMRETDNNLRTVKDSSQNNESPHLKAINDEPPLKSTVGFQDTNALDRTKERIDSEETRIKKDAASLKKLKLKLYMEATKVHMGEGSDRLFADYWDALGRYLSAGDSARSADDTATNGVETILSSFLSTGKLRKLHNLYVKMLMKQSSATRVHWDRIRDHVPLNWRNKVNILPKKRKCKGDVQVSADVDGLALIRKEFGTHSSAFGNCGSQSVKVEARSSTFESENQSIQSQSPRLPGTLEIDHISRYITEKNDYCLSQSAQWLAVIAVRDYVKSIIGRTIDYKKSVEKNKNASKRCRLSSFDFAHITDGNNTVTSSERNIPVANARIAWEHFTSNSCAVVPSGYNRELKSIQNTINSMFSEEIFDRGEENPTTHNMQKDQLDMFNLGKRGSNGQSNHMSNMNAQQSNPMTSSAMLTTLEPAHTRNITDRETLDLEQLGDMSNSLNFGKSEFLFPDKVRAENNQGTIAGFPTGNTALPFPDINIGLGVTNDSMESWLESTGLAATQNTNEVSRTSSAGSGASTNLRPSSSSNINSSGGRGKGSKDLRAMLARSKTK